MRKLYEIDKDIADCFTEEVDMETGEVKYVFDETRLKELEIERERKIVGVALKVKEDLSFIDQCKVEIDRLKLEIKRTEKEVESIGKYLEYACDCKNYKSPVVSIKFSPREAVEVLVPAKELPEEYRKESVSYTANKTAMKDALKNGAELDFAKLVVNANCKVM